MIKRKIFTNLFLLSILSILLTSLLISLLYFNNSTETMKVNLRNNANFIADLLNVDGYSVLEKIPNRAKTDRITIVDPSGKALYDNRKSVSNLTDHSSRSEIIQALEKGIGESRRISDTTSKDTFYYAIKLKDGNIFRVSRDYPDFIKSFLASIPLLALIAIFVTMISLFLARRQSNAIVDPLNNLDLEQPMANNIYDEIAPLISRISDQQNQIKLHMTELQEKQTEFNSVVSNMKEGLILLNQNANILTINESARSIFAAEPGNYLGRKIFVLHRSSALQNLIESALEGNPREDVLTIDGHHYQFLVNPVSAEDKIKGVVLIILDITDKEEAEARRREFTGNVSHELKTPLTSIRGYAEIIHNGLVKSEDIPSFSGRIYSEADRMLTMVNDIMTLSHLDEDLPDLRTETVDLLPVIQDVSERMKPMAAGNQIRLIVDGENFQIKGIRQLIDEMIFNILDNAIKYNRPGGSVRIMLNSDANYGKVRITDTGIGIAREEQERVFERFYRVDKSHSRDSGGTGLGLSIVKHIAKIHRAKLELDSQVNIGTSITILFPKEQLASVDISLELGLEGSE